MKKNIHTSGNRKTGYKNKESTTHKILGEYKTQAEAIEAGRKVAIENETEHVIHAVDGTIREKNSYGNDPNPPKDKS